MNRTIIEREKTTTIESPKVRRVIRKFKGTIKGTEEFIMKKVKGSE